MNDPTIALAHLLQRSARAVVFTGAGISTESGIPDYRSAAAGIWNKIRPIEFQDFLASEEARRESWRRKFYAADSWGDAQPNAGHRAIAHYVDVGKVHVVITQNVDGLHQASGVPEGRVIELHGNANYCKCLQCDKRFELDWVREIFRHDETLPRCDRCGGIVKTATVSFGQPMPAEPMQRAQEESLACDLFVVLGSSLVVYPAAGLPEIAKRNGATLVIVNREPTELDVLADIVIHDEIGPTLSAVLQDARQINDGQVDE